VRDGSYESQNFGGLPLLLVKGAISNHGYIRNSYLTFNLSGAKAINSAVLRLFGSETAGSPEPSIKIAAYAVPTTSWKSGTLTYLNAPAISPTTLSTVTITGTKSKFYTLDLTGYFKQQLALHHTMVSIALKGVGFTDGGTQFNSSRASSNGPALFLNKAASTSTPTKATASPQIAQLDLLKVHKHARAWVRS
jgi:hypothetical protein